MKTILGIGLGAAVLLVGSSSDLPAQEEPTGIVAYRQAVMGSMGGHTGALRAILTDQTQLIDQAAFHAGVIEETAAMIPDLFPEDSLDEPTRALPAIWEDWEGFVESAENLERLAGEVVEVAETGDVDETLAAFMSMGREGCGGCHEDYREEED